jgi:hypothetical protein
MTTINSGTIIGRNLNSTNLTRYAAEPKNSLGTAFSAVAGALTGTVGGVLGGASNDAAMSALLQTQIESQMKMQVYSMQSNVERSKHETNMAPIRNARLG